VSNTQPTKNHNTENKKGEQHSTNQTSLCWFSVLLCFVGCVLLFFLVFCVVMFGWLSVVHRFSFLCCDFWLVERCSPF
jgi:hypothetical protein